MLIQKKIHKRVEDIDHEQPTSSMVPLLWCFLLYSVAWELSHTLMSVMWMQLHCVLYMHVFAHTRPMFMLLIIHNLALTSSCKMSWFTLWHSIFPTSSCFGISVWNLNHLLQTVWLILTPCHTLLTFVALLALRAKARLRGLLVKFSTGLFGLLTNALDELVCEIACFSRSSSAFTFGDSFWKTSLNFHHLELGIPLPRLEVICPICVKGMPKLQCTW